MSNGFLIENASQILQLPPSGACPSPEAELLHILDDGAVITNGHEIVWVGPRSEVPQTLRESTTRLDAKRGVVMPGWVDSHTHLVFAGSRVEEFSLRCSGVTYEEIAKRGGGIVVTSRAVRSASEEELVLTALPRLRRMLDSGITTVEIKSGYGLDTASELKMLRVVRTLSELSPQNLVPTFLGAHTVPVELRHKRSLYVAEIINEMLPEISALGLAEFCDVFCEKTAFDIQETELIFQKASELGLGLRIHAEQLSNIGASRLAAAMGACSADHLEQINEEDILCLKRAGTVATLLPGATLFLGQNTWPPARSLLNAGVPVALATDCNPGSCPTENLALIATLGCVRLGMSPAESVAAITVHAARGLNRQGKVGSLIPGARADIICLDMHRYENFLYYFGVNGTCGVIAGGTVVKWPS
ncbi:MAG: imidazolonepropionase [Myxococcales bacterium]|nr:imidazolonepropionase [Myxococcales bacterium]